MRTYFLAPLSLAALTLGACNHDSKAASAPASNGPDGSRNFAVANFTGVALKGSDDVVVREGAAFAVTATGPQDQLDKLEITVENGTLSVDREGSSWMNNSRGKAVQVTVTMPRLDRALLSGSGTMQVAKASGDSVSASVSGSGDLTIAEVTTKMLDLSVAGSGDLTIAKGVTEKGSYDIAGSGDVSASGVTATNVDLSIAGSGNIDANASGGASVSIVGSGDVKVTGGAKCATSKVGSGDVTCG